MNYLEPLNNLGITVTIDEAGRILASPAAKIDDTVKEYITLNRSKIVLALSCATCPEYDKELELCSISCIHYP
jgi:hypothetical protein